MKSYNLFAISSELSKLSLYSQKIAFLIQTSSRNIEKYVETNKNKYLRLLLENAWELLNINASAFYAVSIRVTHDISTHKNDEVPRSLISLMAYYNLHQEVISHLTDSVIMRLKIKRITPDTLKLLRDFSALICQLPNSQFEDCKIKALQRLISETRHYRSKGEKVRLKDIDALLKNTIVQVNKNIITLKENKPSIEATLDAAAEKLAAYSKQQAGVEEKSQSSLPLTPFFSVSKDDPREEVITESIKSRSPILYKK